MNIFNAILRDPNVSDDFKRVFQGPQLIRQERKQAPRRFTEQPISSFGDLHRMTPERVQEIRDEEHALDLEEQRRERIERG